MSLPSSGGRARALSAVMPDGRHVWWRGAGVLFRLVSTAHGDVSDSATCRRLQAAGAWRVVSLQEA